MRDSGRIGAAIEVLEEIEARHRPVKLALKGWGERSRFAGSKDRAFVSGLVLDALRRKRSLGWMMGDDGARAVILATLRFSWSWPLNRIAEACAEEPYGPGALTEAESTALETPKSLDDAPAPIKGDYPDWLEASLARVFGEDRGDEAAALAARAPVDLRVNTLKTDPARALKALQPLGAEAVELLETALRIPAPDPSERTGSVETIPAFSKGWFEVQDLGSQIAAACAGEVKGKQVLDFCAGGGGKTLALAAAMGSTGQIYAHDSDARRLADTIRRGQRAGVRNLQIRSPVEADPLKGLDGKMDVVFVDAPCTGSGTWRRHPDTKWRLTPEALERRQGEQDTVLDQAAPFVKTGGKLVYVTCSVLAEEDEDRVEAFLARNPAFRLTTPPAPADQFASPQGYVRLTPRSAGTDGFFAAVLEKTA
ncbi:RsmB/NOP family class I SAM-dependent RNA methyltransferase [Caulobacter segnis]|uniref:RsmB/NOP family class I SAM-dependent RNA methyltransferase n=1 Tax=Caulobacter segnis TaxID=88688 RepID=UPI00240FA5A6|nr:RsmB/NOP family class I SAM-dependent RNA methyltransferase [Caulobacter segnis]MDG2522843.1 RsmB/NOP family class I SAM-dependent RNA methyltransferase [Caulobacter segnis]